MSMANLSGSKPNPLVRAHILPLQGLVNRIVRGILRVPLVCKLAGKKLLVVYVVGRKSGRHYAVPVAYTRKNGSLLVGSPFTWIRNLRSGERVHILLLGKQRLADVEVFTEEVEVVEHLAIMASDNHQFAKFNMISFDEHGIPKPEDLGLAWAGGARVAKLTPC